jgi:hypothetical protein
MSLLDDYIESSEAAHGTSTIQYGADALVPINGFDGHDNVRVRFYTYFETRSKTHTTFIVGNWLCFYRIWTGGRTYICYQLCTVSNARQACGYGCFQQYSCGCTGYVSITED